MIPRYKAQRDATEPLIVTAFEQMGFSVTRLSANGLPDLLLSRAGEWHLIECKAGRNGLNKAQNVFHDAARAPIPIIRTVEQAVEWARNL
jgi:hypothetical protein